MLQVSGHEGPERSSQGAYHCFTGIGTPLGGCPVGPPSLISRRRSGNPLDHLLPVNSGYRNWCEGGNGGHTEICARSGVRVLQKHFSLTNCGESPLWLPFAPKRAAQLPKKGNLQEAGSQNAPSKSHRFPRESPSASTPQKRAPKNWRSRKGIPKTRSPKREPQKTSSFPKTPPRGGSIVNP